MIDKDDFDLGSLAASEEVEMEVRHPKTQKPTGWKWTFFGPAHPKSVSVANAALRDSLEEQAAKEQARVNGKKWKEEAEDPENFREKNASAILERTKGFTDVKINGEVVTFSREKAFAILMDRSYIWLFDQIVEFLRASENFIKSSAKS